MNKKQAGGIPTALIYTRVSSDEQGQEGRSLPAQLAHCRRYCTNHGWIVGPEFTDVMSGKRDDRPGYQAVLEEARRQTAAGTHVVVVVAWLHRLGRRIGERVRAWEEFKGLGIEIHSALEGGLQSELVFNILASVAQEESRQLGERISATWRHLSDQGWHRTTLAPWGYRWRPATESERLAGSPRKVLDVDPAAQPHVTDAFSRAAAGNSTRSIAERLSGLSDEERGGYRVTRRTVQDALRNPIYAGRRTALPVAVVGEGFDVLAQPRTRWPAIVSDDTWRVVQNRLDGRKVSKASGRYLLTGLLRCSVCGGPMHGETLPKASQAPRYRCGGDDRTHCHQTALASAVERLVLDQVGAVIDSLVSNPRVQTGIQRAWQARQAAEAPDTTKRVQLLESQLQRARERIRRGTELLVDGTIERQAYDDLVAKARIDSENAEKELAETRLERQPSRTTLPPLEHVLGAAGNWTAVLQGIDIEAQREVLAVLVERVVPIRERPGVYRVDITWTPLGEALRGTAAS
jgi:DNA invertase Pin-like site-specific DNA recombinase